MNEEVTDEVWRDIEGYDGDYQISNIGRVRSFKRYITGKILSQKKDKNGYLSVSLRNKIDGKKYYRVHRLVAKAFIPNPNDYPIINHLDEITSNNLVNNLEWCTYSYNTRYLHTRHPNMRLGEKNNLAKLSKKDVLEIYNLAVAGEISYRKIGLKYDVKPATIESIKNGKSWGSVTNEQRKVPRPHVKGEFNPSAKLRSKQVAEIYKLAWEDNIAHTVIGNEYGISSTMVKNIKIGKSWNSITHHIEA